MKRMRRILSIVVISSAFCLSSFAKSHVDFTNSGGALTGSGAGLSLNASELTSISGWHGFGLISGNLGTVTFSTGKLVNGSLRTGGTFAPGGTFTITGNGTDGIPNGVIFSGTFSGPVAWTMVTLSNGTHSYKLSGGLSGTWYTGAHLIGVTMDLTIYTGKRYFSANKKFSVYGGHTNIVVTPELASLKLLTIGFAGWLGMRIRGGNRRSHNKSCEFF